MLSYAHPRFLDTVSSRCDVEAGPRGSGVVEESMRELRIGTFLALSAAVIAWGCDNGGGTDAGMDDMDGGGGMVDSGPPVDSGPQPDTGMMMMDDGGGTTGACGNPGECDVLEQDCGAGQACRNLIMMAGDTPMGICEQAGTKLEGEACSRATMPECAEGLICFEGFCRGYCCDGRTSDCAVLGHYCQPFSDTNVGICLPSSGCTLLDQSGCEAGEGCYPIPGGITRCSEPAAGAGGDGTECSSLDGCNPGFACIGTPGMCRAFCDPAADPVDCPTDYTCNNLTDHPGVGVCVPPAG